MTNYDEAAAEERLVRHIESLRQEYERAIEPYWKELVRLRGLRLNPSEVYLDGIRLLQETLKEE